MILIYKTLSKYLKLEVKKTMQIISLAVID